MIYDWTGTKELSGPSEKRASRALAERLVGWEASDREEADASRGLTPSGLDTMLLSANSGDPRAQARLGMEIEEKDWDAGQALGTRRAAVEAVEVSVVAGGEKPTSQQLDIAAAGQQMLEQIQVEDSDVDVDFAGAVGHMLSGLLPGYACLETIWEPGGKAVRTFSPVPTPAITFRNSREPLIASRSAPAGTALAPNKFIFHRHRARSGDATRGGLIRPLGWMFVLSNYGVKDLMRFVEKFGMPFISARVDDSAWDKDRAKIAYLIRNFGTDGGAVFSKAVEIDLVDGANSGGDVYFKLLEYFEAAKTKVVLGQTATSGDAGGFSKGQAQAAVRQDILEADCKALAASIRSDVLRPWVMFNYGPTAPVPEVHFACEPPEDLAAKADVVGKLSDAGYFAEPDWVQETFGVPLVKGPDGKPMRSAHRAGDSIALAGEDEKKKALTSRPLSARKRRW